MVKKVFWVLIFIFIASNCLFASGKVFKLRVKIQGSSDSVMYLAHYYGDKQYVDDTA